MGIKDTIVDWLETKAFKGQRVVYDSEGGYLAPSDIEAVNAYNKIAVATRCVNLISDYAAPIELNVYKKLDQYYHKEDKAEKIEQFLDFPNPYQSKYKFWSLHYFYLLMYGTSFIVLQNDGFYLLDPRKVVVEPDPRTYIKTIRYGTNVEFKPNEVAIISLHNSDSEYIGSGVFNKLSNEINLVNRMLSYQGNVLKTGGVHKYAFKTENILSDKIKDKMRTEWKKYYSFSSANQSPPILEGGLSLEKINITMDDLDFNVSITRLEDSIAINLGVPPALLNGGNNNANLSVLLRLFHLSTVLPLVQRTGDALSLLVQQNKAWFKLDKSKTVYVRPDLYSILALRDDADKLASATQGLYTVGIITKNEARIRNGFPTDSDAAADEYMTPQNIAGSAVNPNEGGRPPKKQEGK